MTSKSKEKMAAAFRKLFCTSSKMSPEKNVGGGGGSSSSKNDSPARRLLRHGLHRDQVQPVDGQTNSPLNARKYGGFFKSKKVNSGSSSGPAPGLSSDSKQSETGHQQKVRAKRLMKELKDVQRLEQNNPLDPPFTVELVNDNLFEWHVQLYKVDAESDLATDMKELGVKFILFHVIFPENFPFAPPFIRVISPKIDKGFVMEGGAICMELLTPRGWASAYTMEAVIMQLAASLVKGQVRVPLSFRQNPENFYRHKL